MRISIFSKEMYCKRVSGYIYFRGGLEAVSFRFLFFHAKLMATPFMKKAVLIRMGRRKKNLQRFENVIVLPGTRERLIEKGIHALQEKNYKEACDLLTKALHISEEPGDDEIQMALLLAFYECGQYHEARKLCEKMLRAGNGDYYDIMDLYISILFQLKEYQHATVTLSALVDETQIPSDKKDHLEKLLQISQKMASTPMKVENEYQPDRAPKLFYEDESIEQQTLKVAELVQRDIAPYLGELIDIIGDDHSHPFLKTLLLNVLREQGYDKEILVQKFCVSKRLVPDQLEDVFQMSYYQQVMKKLEEEISQSNPTLFSQIKEMVNRHFFLLYPFEPEFCTDDWAACTLQLVCEYYGMAEEAEHLYPQLFSRVSDSKKECLFYLKKLEKISSPVL
jgi:tetratricopeptide (TPR) repeat protein